MDPDACLREALEAMCGLRDGDEDSREVAVERLRALALWLERGGFAPTREYVEKGRPS